MQANPIAPPTAPRIALWVLPVADLGGVARHALDVARVGVPGWRTAFLLPPGPLVERLRASGAAVLTGAIGPEHGPVASRSTLAGVVDRLRPALVHTHLSYADVIGAAAVPRAVALVTTEHGIADDDLVYHGSRARSSARAMLHRWRLRRADAFVAVSEATLAVARRKWSLPPRLPAYVVPNGVDRPAAPSARTPGLHVVSLARFAPEKRLHDLVASFAILAAEHPDARLTLAGSGPLEADVRHEVIARGLTERVELPGHVDAGDLLARADVLAQLSVFENCSYSLLDALARGVGAVATPVGGNVEILDRGLVEADDHAGVAAELARQALDPDTRPTLAPDWPDVATMSARIGEVYAEAIA